MLTTQIEVPETTFLLVKELSELQIEVALLIPLLDGELESWDPELCA